MRRFAWVAACGALAGTPARLWPQAGCPDAAQADLAAGWDQYRADAMAAARTHFQRAAARCQNHVGAAVGLGYVALRLNDRAEATRWFRAALATDSSTVDALVGLGLLAWRAQDLTAVREMFLRVQALDPANAEARDYLGRLPAAAGPAPRPPLVLPDSTEYPARTHGNHFDVRTAQGWQPFYLKGINLGAALPGRFPSEFPDSATYSLWIGEMGEMDANVVRVYTTHPPHFYGAIEAYNTSHPDRPLWLVHGVWTELPPRDDYDEPVWKADFFGEMRRVVDLLHGRADLPPRPGHASGRYTADVSRWTLAYIIGREWEPASIIAFNRQHPDTASWTGRFLSIASGTAADVWMTRALEQLIAYETDTYRAQRPVAYTNWPTLDPLHHPTETTADEEVAIRRSRGEYVARAPREYDNDAAGLDASLLVPTAAFPAGVFAAYHAYPYYPDFMVLDSGYAAARSPEGPSNYYGYLQALTAHHAGMPVVIAEYGVPASAGIAHLQPQGWHHGGHTEASMAAVNARLTREIAAAGAAGGIVFAWIDEWFKRNWLVMDFELPAERNRLWLNRLDPEQLYGIMALEPEPAVTGVTVTERRAAWRDIAPLYASADGARVRAAADAAYLWLAFERGAAPPAAALYAGFDIIEPRAGDFRWPGQMGPRLPVGIELALVWTGEEARVLADPASNPFRIEPVRQDLPGGTRLRTRPVTDNVPPGLWYGRFEQRYGSPYLTEPNDDGWFDSLRVVTNRPRFGRDHTEYAAVGYDRGVLRPGPPPDGNWEVLPEQGIFEVRIPWALLNVTDPSERRVLQGAIAADGTFGTQAVDAIGIVVAVRDQAGNWRTWPDPGSAVERFSWRGWEVPRWRARRRPVFAVLRSTFRELAPPWHATEHAR